MANMNNLSRPMLFGEPQVEIIQTDDAGCGVAAPQPSQIDLGYRPAAAKTPGQLSPSSAANSRKVDFYRLDSGICEDMRRMDLEDGRSARLTATTTTTRSTAGGVSMSSARLPSFVEYYDADSDGDCQLHLAIASGFTKVVFALIRMAPHPTYLDIQNNELYAPLHIAVLMNQPLMVRRLVVAGATTDIRDRDGNTPLHLAAKRGHLKCAEALLSNIRAEEMHEAGTTGLMAGASASANLRSVLDLKNYHGEHSVHLATFGQHYDFIQFLGWMNADLNVAEGRSGKTALHYAVNKRDRDMTALLATPKAAGGCGVFLNCRDWAGRSPYQCAKINGDADIAELLASIPGCDASDGPDMEEDYEFDTDEEVMNDVESFNGQSSRIVESKA